MFWLGDFEKGYPTKVLLKKENCTKWISCKHHLRQKMTISYHFWRKKNYPSRPRFFNLFFLSFSLKLLSIPFLVPKHLCEIVSTKEPGRRRYSSNHQFPSNLFSTNVRHNELLIATKHKVEMFYSLQVMAPIAKTATFH